MNVKPSRGCGVRVVYVTVKSLSLFKTISSGM